MSKQKNPEFLLYNLENFQRLEKNNLKQEGEKEKYIQKLLGENLSRIFSNLIFINDGQRLLNPNYKAQEEYFNLDTLAFDKKRKWFVIIEYKRETSNNLYVQTDTYLDCLCLEEGEWDKKTFEIIHENRDELLSILNEKGIKIKKKDIAWDETKGICIATEIHKYVTKKTKNKNIKVLEISFYNDKKILYIDTNQLPDWLTIAPTEVTIKGEEKNNQVRIKRSDNKAISDEFNDIIKMEWISPKIKELLINLDKEISFKKNLVREINIKNLNYYPVINYIVEKKILLSVVVKTKQINVFWNFKDPSLVSQELLNLLNDYQIEYSEKNHRGSGQWHFPIIDTENSFLKLRNFIRKYEIHCGNNLKLN